MADASRACRRNFPRALQRIGVRELAGERSCQLASYQHEKLLGHFIGRIANGQRLPAGLFFSDPERDATLQTRDSRLKVLEVGMSQLRQPAVSRRMALITGQWLLCSLQPRRGEA